ncbi:MAG TPA: guanylate kinase, partial [Dissulfurispiraceae bacterium]|nr:guanylate kinase [Dissulfurispiraceae bacterium]
MTKALRGNLFVVSAPSGTGKTTLCERLLSSLSDIRESVSYTTRRPRPGEIQDVHYTFVDEEEFRSMITEGEFVEWARVHGNFYGTSKRRIEDLLNSGADVLLDIDIQGGSQIRR